MKLHRRPDSEWQARRPQRLTDKNPFDAMVLSVPDGDTLCVSVDWDGSSFSGAQFVRIAGIDAPEFRGPDVLGALRAQQALERLVLHQVVTVRPRRIWRDPYYRVIASVTLQGRDIGTCLLESGFVKTRSGTKPLQTR